jgi:hypothetical protein
MRHKIILSLALPFLILLGIASHYVPKLLEKSPILMFLLMMIPGCILTKEIYSTRDKKEHLEIAPVTEPQKTASYRKSIPGFLIPFLFFVIYLGPASHAADSYLGMLLFGTISGVIGAIAAMPSRKSSKSGYETLDNSIMTGIIMAFVIFIVLPIFYLALHACGFPMRPNCRISIS